MRAWIAAIMVLSAALPASAQPPAANATPAAPEAIPAGQLPDTAVPLYYSLHFTLDPQREDFDGEVHIRVRLREAADHLWLHGRDLKVSAVTWRDAAGAQGSAQYAQKNEDGVARVDFGRMLPAQEIELEFDYSAAFSHSLESIYKVTRGKDSYLVTQFEDIAARRAFPGFDQPSFKTPYDIILTVPEKTGAIANTRQISDERAEPGTRTLHFATTEPLPTYLVAFAVGAWDQTRMVPVPANEIRSKPFYLRVLGAKGSKPQLDYALKTTPAIVAELERYFGVPYPFDKLDLLAAPDFAYGAMENAGLITFREQYLLLDDKAAPGALQDYQNVNTHELAHQWFGDYVTLNWWNDTWLNEAFATWLEAKINDRLHPEYRRGLEQTDDALDAMRGDSLASARRIREPIVETGDISDAFDNITYQKGGGVLAMFESWLGEDKFREGIRLFMRRHAYGGASADDLISALAEASGKGEVLGKAMRSFLDQPGVPLVNVALSCRKDHPPQLTLSQSRYLPLGTKARQGAQWTLPVCLKLGKGDDANSQCQLLDQPKKTYELDACPDWVLPNAGGTGYYRYQMADADLAALAPHVAQLTPAEQMIHADAVSAAFHRGDLPPEAVLQAMPQFAGSAQPSVATFLFDDFNWIRERIADAHSDPALRSYAIELYRPQIDRLGYRPRSGDTQDDSLLRHSLVQFLALDLSYASARQAMLDAAQSLWKASTPDHLALDGADPNTLPIALAVLAQEGGESVMRRLMAELRSNNDAQQRPALIEALGAIDDPELSAQVRDFALTGGLQQRELSVLIRAHQSRPANRATFWNWMQANFDRVLPLFPDFAQHRLPGMASAAMCSTGEAKALEAYFTPKLPSITGGKRALAQALEGVQVCAALRSKQLKPGLRHWMQNRPPPDGLALAEAIASPSRSAGMRSRNLYRHPQQTLEFFGVTPQMTVAEVWPGGGWYTEILAPYLAKHGKYIAVGFVTSGKDVPDWRKQSMKDLRAKFAASPELYSGAAITELGLPAHWKAAPAGSADMVLTFRNIHNWIAGGYEHEMFKAFAAALKPGGVLGIVEHRAAAGTTLEQMKQSGYVTEDYVIQLATEAGLKLAAKSEVNANPLDTKNYAEGVWTLPPTYRLKDKDRDRYLAIGESDRMTLKFVKP